VIIISRDVIILLGIAILSILSIPLEIRPAFVSKVTTALQLITILLALAVKSIPGEFHQLPLLAIYWLTSLFTILSGLNYIARGVKLINHNVQNDICLDITVFLVR
jgi:cardiolipin synthase